MVSEACAPQASDLHDVFTTTSEDIQNAVWSSQLRTQVIYGIHNTKVKDIRTSLIKQPCAELNILIGGMVEDIWQDKFDKARFYIRYDTVEHRRLVAANGFTITNRVRTVTVPKQQFFMGRIENVSPLFTLEIMQILLKKYGELHEIRFATYANSTISRRKLIFSYSTMHPNMRVPRSIELDGVKMEIIDQTSLLQCTHCNKYGHWSSKCNERDSGVESNSEHDREMHDDSHRSSPTLPKARSDLVQEQGCPLLKESFAKLTLSDVDPIPQNKAEQMSAGSTTTCAEKRPPNRQCDVPDPECNKDDHILDGSVIEDRTNEEEQEENDLLDFFKVWDEEIRKKTWKHINTYTLKKYVEKSLMFGT